MTIELAVLKLGKCNSLPSCSDEAAPEWCTTPFHDKLSAHADDLVACSIQIERPAKKQRASRQPLARFDQDPYDGNVASGEMQHRDRIAATKSVKRGTIVREWMNGEHAGVVAGVVAGAIAGLTARVGVRFRDAVHLAATEQQAKAVSIQHRHDPRSSKV